MENRAGATPSVASDVVSLASTQLELTPSETPATQYVLQRLAHHGWMMRDASQPQVMLSLQSIEEGKTDIEKFGAECDTMLTKIPGLDHTSPLHEALGDIDRVIQERRKQNTAEATATSCPLAVILAIQNLEARSTKIILAVEEATRNATPYRDNARIQADTHTIRAYLLEDLVPFLNQVEQGGLCPPVEQTQQKMVELQSHLQTQKKNTNQHLRESENGIRAVRGKAGNPYHLKTNHLPRYAAASVLEVLLRAYHIVLSELDLEGNGHESTEFQRLQLTAVAENRKLTMINLFEGYGKERAKRLLTSNETWLQFGLRHRCIGRIQDIGWPDDKLYPRLQCWPLTEQLAKEKPAIGPFIWRREDKGEASYRCKNKQNHQPAKTSTYPDHFLDVVRAAVSDNKALLRNGGLVWQIHFQPHTESIDDVVAQLMPGMQAHPSRDIDGKHRLPKTVPLVNADVTTLGEGLIQTRSGDGSPVHAVLYHQFGRMSVAQYQCNNDGVFAILGSVGYVSVSGDNLSRCELITDLGDYVWIDAHDGQIPRSAVDFAKIEPKGNCVRIYQRPCYLGIVVVPTSDGTTPHKLGQVALKDEGNVSGKYSAWFINNQSKVEEAQEFLVLCLKSEEASDKGQSLITVDEKKPDI